MRKATVFWIGLATVCGALLFHTSQKVTDGRTALRNMERELLREEESLRVLQAEWSYLNQPERLEKLAREHLQLTPLHGRQFARVSDINERLDDDALASATAASEAPAAIEPAAGTPAAQAPVTSAATASAPPPPPRMPAAAKPQTKPVAPTSKPMPMPMPAPTPAPARKFDDVLKNLGVN